MKLYLVPVALLLLCGSATAQSNNVTQQVGVCDPRVSKGATCILPNSDGSINVVDGSGSTQGSPIALTPTNDSLSITTGGTAQQAIAANATRKGCTIQNPATAADQGISASENAYVNFGGTAAAASTSFELLPGAAISCSPLGIGTVTSSVSVVAATTAHKLIVWEFN